MKLNKALKIIIACGGFLFVCIFISLKAHASGLDSLPYYVDNENFVFGSYSVLDVQSFINNKFINDGAPEYNVDFLNNTTLFYTYNSNDVDYLVIYTMYNSNQYYYFSNYTEIYDSFNVNNDSMSLTFNQCYKFILYINNGHLAWYTWYPFETQTFNLFGEYYYPVYINDVFYNQSFVSGVLNSSDTIVLTNYLEEIDITGSAIAPNFGAGAGVGGSDFLGSGADFGASVSQATKPTAPTITNYTWNTYNAPSVDTSTLETLIQSLIDIVKYNTTYIVGGITGLIENLLTNIQNMFNYIGALIEYSLRVLVTNIQNAIQNLYENFKSLVEPILQLLEIVKEKVDYITEEFSQEEWEENYSNCEFISAYDNIQDNCDEIRDILTHAEERNYYHLYLTFPKPDGTNVESMISFDWLYPLRSSYRPFLWVIVLVELFVTACRLLGAIVGGKAK